MADEEALITMRQAAERLSVHLWTVRRMVMRGELPAIRLGRTVRIRPADLRALIDAHATTTDTDSET